MVSFQASLIACSRERGRGLCADCQSVITRRAASSAAIVLLVPALCVKRVAAFACLCALALVTTASASVYPYTPTSADLALAKAATVHRSDLGLQSPLWVRKAFKSSPDTYGCNRPPGDTEGLIVTGYAATQFNFENKTPRVYSEGWVFENAAMNQENWYLSASQGLRYASCQRSTSLKRTMSVSIGRPQALPLPTSFLPYGDHVFACRYPITPIPGRPPIYNAYGVYDMIIINYGRTMMLLINEYVFKTPQTAASLRQAYAFDIRLLASVRSRVTA
jgi:hypothetical protein